DDVGAEYVPERGLVVQRIGVGLANEFARHRTVVEPLCQPVDDGSLQRVVVQDGFVHEGRELRLAPRHVFGLAADARPDGIDLIERRPGLVLGHGGLPGSCLSLAYLGRPQPRAKESQAWANYGSVA